MNQLQEQEPKTFTDLLRKIFKNILSGIAEFLNRLGVRPNVITAFGLIGNLAAGILIATGHLYWGGLTALIVGPLDALDGVLARLRSESSEYGAFVDSITDRYSEMAIFGGLLVYFSKTGNWLDSLLIFSAAIGSFMVSYTRARAESLGQPSRGLSTCVKKLGKLRIRKFRKRNKAMVEGIRIGPVTLSYYGMLIMAGVVCATLLSYFEAKKRGFNTDVVLDSLTWIVLGGIIGARIWHILTPPASMVEQGITTYYYLTHPLDAIAIWRGGVGIPGAVAGGALAFYLYARKRGISFGAWADIFAPGVALGQAIGRWGNFINQEVYGSPTNLPWAITIDPEHRLPEFMDVATYHPLFLYESLFNFANMGFLLWLSHRFSKKLKPVGSMQTKL